MTDDIKSRPSTLWLRGLWAVAGALVGVVVALALLTAVELYSAVVHPFPPDFGGTEAEVCAHVARYPGWVLGTVVPMWGFTAYGSTWIARRMGGGVSAALVGLLLVVGALFNIAMLPYPMWFKAMIVVVAPLAVTLAFRRLQPSLGGGLREVVDDTSSISNDAP